jgi:ABC-type multidrug transport system fused ATPase/permease subunit
MQAGELIASMFGDSARFKNGLRGVLVHGATNGVLFLGVTIILCVLSRALGAIFAVAGLLIGLTSLWAAARLFRISLKQRKRDGVEANQIQAAMQIPGALRDRARVPRPEGARDVEQTRIQGVTTWIVHGVFGLAVLAALQVGSQAIVRGELTAGDMILFVLYALMMRGPAARVARQGARTGAILGSAYRLIRIIKLGRKMARRPAVQPAGEPYGLPAVEMR